jgi:hypothetical protein
MEAAWEAVVIAATTAAEAAKVRGGSSDGERPEAAAKARVCDGDGVGEQRRRQ